MEWEDDVHQSYITSTGLNENYTAKANLIHTWVDSKKVPDVCSVSVEGFTDGYCYDYACKSGAGQSPLWNAFYSPKKGDTAQETMRNKVSSFR